MWFHINHERPHVLVFQDFTKKAMDRVRKKLADRQYTLDLFDVRCLTITS